MIPFLIFPLWVLIDNILIFDLNKALFNSLGWKLYGQWHSTAWNPALAAAVIAFGSDNSFHKNPRLAENFNCKTT